MEDLTNPEDIRVNPKCDRKVSLYGYLRGTHLKNKSQIHMPGWIPPLISYFLALAALCLVDKGQPCIKNNTICTYIVPMKCTWSPF